MEQPDIEKNLQIIRDAGFGRIAEKIQLTWGDKTCAEYLNKLTVDDRGNRQGFPVDVFSAILKLLVNHKEKFKFSENDIWDSVPPYKEKQIVSKKQWTSNQDVDTPPRRSLTSLLIPFILMGLALLLWKAYFNL